MLYFVLYEGIPEWFAYLFLIIGLLMRKKGWHTKSIFFFYVFGDKKIEELYLWAGKEVMHSECA